MRPPLMTSYTLSTPGKFLDDWTPEEQGRAQAEDMQRVLEARRQTKTVTGTPLMRAPDQARKTAYIGPERERERE